MRIVTQYIYQYKLEDDVHLLLNTMTGAMDTVNGRIAELLKPRVQLDDSLLTTEEAEFLNERGYLVDENNEQALVTAWFAEFKRRMKAFHFIVCPTFTCNLRCPYCFEGLDIRTSKTAMSVEQIDHMFKSMDLLIQERDASRVDLQFYGGEPFLKSNQHIVEQITERAASRGWPISGITNGTQIHHYFELFERIGSEAVDQIQITLDGPEEIHDQLRIHANGRGSYQEIRRNVDQLLAMGIPVLLRVNTGKDNVAHLPMMFEEFEKMGWTAYDHFQCQISPITDHGCTGCVPNYQPEFKLLRQLHELMGDWEAARERYHLMLGYDMERRTSLIRSAIYGKESFMQRGEGIDLTGCSASKQHYVIYGADGLIYACPETVGQSEMAIGRFTPQHELDRQRWNAWEVNIANTSKCSTCNIAPVCGGACPLQGFNGSSFDAYEPHCNFAQQTIKAYLDLNRSRIMDLISSSVGG
ncbi:radical SAM/SPASM domain-containing protein [Paenibacillus sp.]|uniref:radical SAM/SPASM domain-containing protein n=1 Tax=Paenibacillus sp. TaxID=58172 RepID=UPI002816F7DD|nr:radical SAM protein [Paenibacillus sp.]MDR0268156.1 radical SAM protein [Paenibacillus sp.]